MFLKSMKEWTDNALFNILRHHATCMDQFLGETLLAGANASQRRSGRTPMLAILDDKLLLYMDTL